jgi:N-hydroxyarylamine O-acetyltransferase
MPATGGFVETCEPFDLEAYLNRIGYAGEMAPSPAVLAELHLAHATHVPFENLDILLGQPIRLDLESLQAKLVRGRRGGYCFEQNTLFAAALERVGFQVTRLAARVRLRASQLTPRTHMLLHVETGGTSWLADVGFGGTGPLYPVPLEPGRITDQFAWSYRVVDDGGFWVLQSLTAGSWQDQYAFTLEPQHPVDFELANYYTSTHPTSHFVQTLTIQRVTPAARYILRNRELLVDRGGDQTVSRAIADEEELLQVLADPFGLEFPAGTRFRAQGE